VIKSGCGLSSRNWGQECPQNPQAGKPALHVAQTFLSAGSGDFPVARPSPTFNHTRRIETDEKGAGLGDTAQSISTRRGLQKRAYNIVLNAAERRRLERTAWQIGSPIYPETIRPVGFFAPERIRHAGTKEGSNRQELADQEKSKRSATDSIHGNNPGKQRTEQPASERVAIAPGFAIPFAGVL
jgi:hypothetical protein